MRLIAGLFLTCGLLVDLTTCDVAEAQSERRYHVSDPAETRLFLTSTARMQPKGTTRIELFELFFPAVSYGISGRASVAGGVSFVPHDEGQIAYLAPRVLIYRRPTVSVVASGFGSVYLGDTQGDDNDWLAVVHVVSTVGTSERAATLGLVVAATNGEGAWATAFTVGGELQVSNHLKLISENMFGFGDGLLLMAGPRVFGNRFALDFALAVSPEIWDELELPAFPWLGLSIRLGS